MLAADKEATQAMKWGMSDFESEEADRPEYKGEIIKSPVDGSDMTFYPEAKRACSQMIAMCVTAFMILLVMAFIGVVFWLKSLPGLWPDYASLINSVGIQVFNAVYNIMAVTLTDNENYRTDTQYEDSLIFKLFGFQFVNSYASLFYIAFIKGECSRKSKTRRRKRGGSGGRAVHFRLRPTERRCHGLGAGGSCRRGMRLSWCEAFSCNKTCHDH